MKIERRLRLFIVARIVVAVLFLISTIVLKLSDVDAIGDIQFKGIIKLMVLSCLFSAVSLALLGRQGWLQVLTRLQIVWDVLLVTLLLMLTDGIASPYSFLYLLAIMNAGMLLSRQQALYTAGLCVILYGAMVDLQYYGMLGVMGLNPEAARLRGELVIFYMLFLHLIGFVVAALMGSHLAERARVTEINYEELKQLHSTIVEHLESGLMTITQDGLIRVFNPYSEKLTNLTQACAYGRPVDSVFPALELCGRDALFSPSQGEFFYRSPAGNPMTIGYAAVPFRNLLGEAAGLIVTLKDLTGLKQMELALKRSDRLAALGELSARMAHEIRNPLAAISGSVQLLSEHGRPSDHEKRLLAIVLRESERLNGLITDFLAYARPVPPRKERFNLYQMLMDLQSLLHADSRFEKIALQVQVPEEFLVWADRDQLQQVLLNLLHNAADAMPDGGEVSLQAGIQPVSAAAGGAAALYLKVLDQGTGLDEETCQHLFEPFWTTKTNGTGLGLATVYRIIEGHGGCVQAETRNGGGTVVTVLLPMAEEEPDENQNPGC